MQTGETLLLILAAVTLFGALAQRIGLAEPIVWVLAGLALSLVPGLPEVDLNPDWVFLLVLLPLLHAQAWGTSWKEFRSHLRTISLLAVGLVLFTTAVVAWAAKLVVPDWPWAAALAFGAIVSPPDALAVSAIAGRLRLPRRIVTILEGESLVNDATGLVAYRLALGAVASGSFALSDAAGDFLFVAVGGIAVGLIVGFGIAAIFRRVKDASIAIALSLVAPYLAYLLAERCHVSGVLAVVAEGIVLGTLASEVLSATARLEGFGFWQMVVFILNGVAFLVIGLQLPSVTSEVCKDESWATLVLDAGVVIAAAIAARNVWMILSGLCYRALHSMHLAMHRPLPWRHTAVIGWAGMRGDVSLAAASALPRASSDTPGFPCRELIVFMTFAVILGTLVVQGTSMPWFIRKLGVATDGVEEEEREREARVATATAAFGHVKALAKSGQFLATSTSVVAAEYADRVRHLHQGRATLLGEAGDDVMHVQGTAQLRREGLKIERDTRLHLLKKHLIERETLLKLERELDLEETRLLGSMRNGN
ncbi:MAG: Na+/H+ antiporter [Planctomycetes bacterium]|nr:Na+/H+ antiporter [Planctomycetota bacterium]